VNASVLQTTIPRAPFDAVAETYDQGFTFSKIGQAQRSVVWRELGRTFHAGDRVLEIGCGTGVDACFLAQRGVRVLACDSSQTMVQVAMRRVRESGTHSVDLRVLAAENLSEIYQEGAFDGVFSNFGALNCVDDLHAVGVDIGRLLKPGGTALMCFLGPSCVWEIAWYLLKANPRKAFRRWHGSNTAQLAVGSSLQVRYYGIGSLKRILAPSLRLRSWRGVGLLVPPSYVELLARRFPTLLKLAEWTDRLLARCPVIRGGSDHILLKFERVTQ
jgi:ubiquinone/menaquinone biosynthesis C-methylase UbiE